MHAKHLLATIIVLLAPLALAAQLLPPHRRVAPAPRLTPEVQRIRQERTPFRVTAAPDVQLPPSVDNSQTRFFPPLINQTGGSCAQAAGIGYMMTYELNRLLQRDASRPENRLSYLFIWNFINEGEDQGSFVEEGLQIAKGYGVMSEADFGTPGLTFYKWATGYELYERAMHNRATEILAFDDSINTIKRYLYDAGRDEHPGGVLTYSTDATGWEFDLDYSGPSATGYHCLQTRLGNDGPHALTIVGYDDLVTYTDDRGVTHTGAFIVCNSWGDYYYHDRGRFYLVYDFFRDPTISPGTLSDRLNGVRVSTYEPKVICHVGFSYTSRDDLAFGMIATPDRHVTSPSTAPIYSPIFHHQGGDFNMQGQFRQAEMDMAIDFTTSNPDTIQKYFLSIFAMPYGKKTGSGQLTSLEVIDQRGDTPVHYPYRAALPVNIRRSNNLFPIPLTSLFELPVSPVSWMGASTFLLRTAGGRPAKMQIQHSKDNPHVVSIRYAL